MSNSLFETRDRWGKNQTDLFRELLPEEGITQYVLIYMNGEGRRLPTGLEDQSVLVVTSEDRLLDVVLDWDPEKTDPDGNKGYYKLRFLTEPNPATYVNSSYYRAARKELGLDE